jgi:sulfate/thiosulfate transport system permease protein
MAQVHRNILPGFRLSLGVTLFYMTLLVVLPLGALALRATSMTRAQFVGAVWSPRALSAYALTFGASFLAAAINVALGLLVAWVLVRYQFPFKRFFDAIVDLPFALPTAVAGLVYANLYVENGWLGQWLVPLGFHGAYTREAVVLVLVFIGLPFVVRTVQPVLESFDADAEEAAASLGATRWQTFLKVLLPPLTPALSTGFALAFARSLGEYGSVIFVTGGGTPFRTEIAPKLIVEQLEQFHYADATAIAVVLLAASFLMLIPINLLERWSKRFNG